MPAYIVFIREKTVDQSELDRYSANVKESFDGHDVKFLATYGPMEVLEGPPMEGVVILEFADMEAARAWYSSRAYQAAAQHRFRGADYRGFIVQGR